MTLSAPASSKSALLERDRELEELDVVASRAAAGEGGVMVLEGAAGAGKSALLAAACARAESSGLTVLRARGSDLEREFGFGALRQLFEGALAGRPSAERERLLSGAARPAGRIVALDAVPGDGFSDGFSTLHAIYWLTLNLASERPLLLAVDDAHWVDASSLKALSYLAARIPASPVALLVSVRSHEPDAPEALLDGLRLAPGALRLSPAPLTEHGVAELVRTRLPSASDGVCAAVAEATGGNPFLLHELIRSLAPNGSAPEVTATAVHEASVLSIGDRVMRRVEQLGGAAPALASSMAVVGPEGSLALASRLAGLPAEEGGRIANVLRRIDVLADEDPFLFVHPLVRRSIYDALSRAERDGLHAGAAKLIKGEGGSAEAAAAHLAALPPRGSDDVARALVAAASEAGARAAPQEAVRWLKRALEEGAAQPDRAVILENLGALQSVLRDPAAIPHLHEALRLADDPEQRIRVAAALAELLASAGQWEVATEVLEAAEDDVRSVGPELEAELATVRAGLMIYDPAFAADLARERPRLEELSRGEGWTPRAIAALLSVQASHFGEGVEQVRSYARRALEDGRLFGERGAGSWASIHVLGSLVEVDEYEWVLAACDDLTLAARDQGSVFGQLASSYARGWMHVRQGELALGEAELRSAMDMANQAELPMVATTGVAFLQDAMVERPGNEDLAALVETTELPPAFARTWSGANLLLVRGRLRFAKLDRDGAVEDLRAANDIQTALGWGPAAAPSRSLLALALPAAERDEALRLADEELRMARSAGLPRCEGIALRALGVLTGGESGIETLRQSAAMLGALPARLEHARSLVELGAALRRAQRKSEARTELVAGMELANSCGAHALVERARSELGAAGARPRRIATTGVAALTASERRVVDLAAGGATNSEIAQELFVSLKTVETHLYNAYAKLGLSGRGSRARLEEALAQSA